jgi:hypothetical protein
MHLSPDLIVRPYGEIVDDVLVAMLGGIVNEPVIYDVREASYPLSQGASSVRGITGTADGEHYTFLANVDWTFDATQNAVVWLAEGKKPDEDDPVFYIDYLVRNGAKSPLTDVNVGSVTRTLTEAISRELAVLYRQVNLTYQSGFIDLATGKSLDFVVAILDIERKTADYAAGLVTFFRASAASGNITIPQGVRLTTSDGIIFETTSERTLQRGQVRIDAPVRAGADFKGPAGRVDANTITTLIFPIEGIDRVTNFDPTALGAADETDEELRERAKSALRGLGQCTIDGLIQAAREARATNVEVMDPMFPPDDPSKHTPAGRVAMIVEVEPARFLNVVSAVNAARAAGVSVQFLTRYIFIHPRLAVTLRRPLPAEGKEQVKADILQALEEFLTASGSGNPVPGKGPVDPATGLPASPGMLEAIKAVADVEDVRIADLLVWRTILETGTQLGQRVAARELITTPDGSAPATDEQIETGDFSIQIEAQWFPVLEMEPADIQLADPV